MRWIGPALSAVLLGVAIWFLDDLLTTTQFDDVLAELAALPWQNVAAAVAFTVLSYAVLVLYDKLALAHVGRKLPLLKVAVTSFTSYVFAHNIGFGLVTGGSVRYRLYGNAGLSAIEIGTVSLFCGLTFAVGITLMSGVALLTEPASVLAGIPDLPEWLGRALGLACLAAVAAYVACCAFLREPIEIRGVAFRFPRLSLCLGQIAVSVFDLTLAALAMYAVLPQLASVTPLAFIGAYVLAIIAGAISNLPGGLGVFEVALVLLLPDQPPDTVLAGALAYRVIYYLIPFALAALLIVAFEVGQRGRFLRSIGGALGGLLVRFAPQLSGAFVLAAGIVLLISGASPSTESRLEPLNSIVPLALVEASHLLASIIGLMLVILARALMRRLDAAYYLAIAGLGAGILFSLLKGFDYEEAIILGVVLAIVALSRKEFYRRTPLFADPFTPTWLLTVATVIGTSAWIGFFSYRHVEYDHDLWWTFALNADAPRFLRALLVVTVGALALGLYQALRPSRPLNKTPSRDDLAAAKQIIANAATTDANLALLGDKQFLFNETASGFVMYGAQGGSLIAMGDPVAPDLAGREELAWSFRELCDAHDHRPVFYQVTEDNLPIYIDMGLSLQKLGEEAVIPLQDFSLQGSQRRDLRQSHTRAVREGLTFNVVPPADIDSVIDQLKAVSDSWLSEKSTREKTFSIGAFSTAYIANFPIAVARANDRIVGFANIWQSGHQEELSVDLMRHVDNAPYGVMDFLFAETMLWGKAQGYRAFNLGLAPLSGLENHPLAPIWQRIGAFTFRHGENFYNFEGLRRYKAKFAPHWRAKYVAAPGGLNVPAALFDVATLISGGIKGLIAK